jgi:FtsH-binding integral membrane protein
MSRFDADSSTVAGEESSVSEAASLTERVLGRNLFAAKVAAFYVAMFALTYVANWAASSSATRQLTAIVKWFVVIFAAGTLVLGLVVKVSTAVMEYRRGR